MLRHSFMLSLAFLLVILPVTQSAAGQILQPTGTAPDMPDQAAKAAPAKPANVRLLATVTNGLGYRHAVISEDTSWRGEVLVEGDVFVAPQATLRIEAGTVVRFGGDSGSAALLVQGRLAAQGTADRPIHFTGRFVEPQAGDWQGIVFLGSEKNNLFEWCRVKGATVGIELLYSRVTMKETTFDRCLTGVRSRDSLLAMTRGGAQNGQIGLELHDSENELREIRVSGNEQGVVVHGGALALLSSEFQGNSLAGGKVDDAIIKVDGCVLAENGDGLAVSGGEGSIGGSLFRRNLNYGLQLDNARLRVSGNEFSGNIGGGLVVADGSAAAWGNIFRGNGRYDVINEGSDQFLAIGNWWEGGNGTVGERILDRRQDGRRGPVLYLPPLPMRP